VVDWGKKGLEGKTAALINLMRRLRFPTLIRDAATGNSGSGVFDAEKRASSGS
jgi:hypothetical protein